MYIGHGLEVISYCIALYGSMKAKLLNFQTPDAADERGETAAWKVLLHFTPCTVHSAVLSALACVSQSDSPAAPNKKPSKGPKPLEAIPVNEKASRAGNLAVLQTLSSSAPLDRGSRSSTERNSRVSGSGSFST